jgi:hypothetical protein
MACKNKRNHTRCPKDYKEWMIWSNKMVKDGYRQVMCIECGRYDIWTNKPIKKSNKVNICSHNFNKFI